MAETDIKKRLEDYRFKCEKSCSPVSGIFMSPAEIIENERSFPDAVFIGGYSGAERKIAVFLPEWMSQEDVNPSDYISCIKIKSFFGVPSHRDYMGAILSLGISRDRLGDIIVKGDEAYVLCLPTVAELIAAELERAGRTSVRACRAELEELTEYERQTKAVTFTVKSLRLDAVAADMFFVSRTSAAQAIREGLVSLNYRVCEKTDAAVGENDVISFRGKGKGKISEIGGKSRRDRLFVTAEIFK